MKRLLVFAALLLAWPVGATNYHLDWNGDNTAVGTSIANAWQTLRWAQGVLAPGDTLLIEPGTYTVETDRFDSMCDDIVIKNRFTGDPDSFPVFVTRGYDPQGDANDNHRIFVLNHDNIKLSGLVFRPDSANTTGQKWIRIGIEVLGDNAKLDSLTFDAATDSVSGFHMFRDTIVIQPSAASTQVSNCTIVGAGNPTDPNGSTGRGIAVLGTGSLIQGNKLARNYQSNIYLAGSNNIVKADSIGGTWRTLGVLDTLFAEGDGIYHESWGSDNTIEYCQVTGAGQNIPAGGRRRAGYTHRANSSRIRNNDFWGNAIGVRWSAGTGNAFFHNNVVDNYYTGMLMNSEVPGANSNNVFLSNIVYSNGVTVPNCSADSTFDVSIYLGVDFDQANDALGNIWSHNYIKPEDQLSEDGCNIFDRSANAVRSVTTQEDSSTAWIATNADSFSVTEQWQSGDPHFAAGEQVNFTLTSHLSPFIDKGRFLTEVRQAGPDADLWIKIADARFFRPTDFISGQMAAGADSITTTQLSAVDYVNDRIQIPSGEFWTTSFGDSIALDYGHGFGGRAGPDVGSHQRIPGSTSRNKDPDPEL